MRARIIPIVLIVFAISAILHSYVAYRLLNTWLGLSGGATLWIALAAAATMLLIVMLGHGRHVDLAAAIGDVWLGVIFQLFVWCLLTEPVRLLLGLADISQSNSISAIAAVVITVCALSWGAFRALGRIRPRYVDIGLERLPVELDGLRVVQIADTHASRFLGHAWMRRVVTATNSERPDIVCHTGDLADGSIELRTPTVEALAGVECPQRYFITGNHEYFTDADYWGATMERLGWTFLHNRHARFERDGGSLVIAGIDDPTGDAQKVSGHGPRLANALENVGPQECVLLLAHQPKQVADALAHGVDLQLAGHTHGGQMWPFHYLVRLDQKVVSGLARRGRTQLYVSRGVGFWGPPFRIGASPELTVLTLRRASAAP